MLGVPRELDGQVGGAKLGLARPELGSDLRVRKVAQQEERPLEAVLGNEVARLQVRGEDAARERLLQPRFRVDLEIDLAKTAFEHCDLDNAILDRRLRRVGHGEEVAALAVVALDASRRVVEPVEIEGLADELAYQPA